MKKNSQMNKMITMIMNSNSIINKNTNMNSSSIINKNSNKNINKNFTIIKITNKVN